MKLITKVLILVLICISSVQLFAEETYRHEVGILGSMSKEDAKDDPDGETTMYGLGYTFYFNPVKINESQPLAEAAFLNKASSISVAGLKSKYEIGESGSNAEITFNSIGISGTYVLPQLPVFFYAAYLRSTGEVSGDYYGFEGDDNSNIYSFGLGYFFTDNIAAGFDYEYSKLNMDIDAGYYGNYEASIKANSYNGYLKAVLPVAGEMYINFSIGYSHEIEETTSDLLEESKDKNNEYSVITDFYITPKIGIGAGLKVNRGENKSDEGETYMVKGNFFFNNNVGLGIAYSNFRAKDTDEEENEQGVDLEVAVRF